MRFVQPSSFVRKSGNATDIYLINDRRPKYAPRYTTALSGAGGGGGVGGNVGPTQKLERISHLFLSLDVIIKKNQYII